MAAPRLRQPSQRGRQPRRRRLEGPALALGLAVAYDAHRRDERLVHVQSGNALVNHIYSGSSAQATSAWTNSRKRAPEASRLRGSSGGHRGAPGPAKNGLCRTKGKPTSLPMACAVYPTAPACDVSSEGGSAAGRCEAKKKTLIRRVTGALSNERPYRDNSVFWSRELFETTSGFCERPEIFAPLQARSARWIGSEVWPPWEPRTRLRNRSTSVRLSPPWTRRLISGFVEAAPAAAACNRMIRPRLSARLAISEGPHSPAGL